MGWPPTSHRLQGTESQRIPDPFSQGSLLLQPLQLLSISDGCLLCLHKNHPLGLLQEPAYAGVCPIQS